MNELKKLRYEVGVAVTHIEKGEVNGDTRLLLLKVMEDLKALEAQTTPVSQDMEVVSESDVILFTKSLRMQETTWSLRCAEVIDKLWRNLKKTDRKLIRS